ncbi:alpha/beta fold hydrolase [Streptosporangiaceae bacterium NEAU-GS5]|nr:alpha/beta fold hydrolase [Streptosporangiaceae bacterium NEAU-GS5]
MRSLAYTRSGAGAPLVLLHALGSSRHSWEPVIPALAERYDVIAVDLPGFGESGPLPEQTEALPANLAAAVAALLDGLGIASPHVAGNSLGGWIALEFAHIRPVASLTLLSPAGLWRGVTPLYQRISLRATRWAARHAAGLLSGMVNHRLGRMLVLGQTHGRPTRMTPEQARQAIHAMGSCPGFAAAYNATARRCYRSDSRSIDAPVTVAFGSRDVLLPPRLSRHLDQLPAHIRQETLPGCGHIPMYDDPAAVAAVISRAGLGDPDAARVPLRRPR